jgi:hypothetical protein
MAEKQVHLNYIKASNLIFASVVLSILSECFSGSLTIPNIIISLLIVGLGISVRKGKSWIKYILLVLTITGLAVTAFNMSFLIQNPLTGLLYFVQALIQIWVVILLFKVPEIVEYDSIDNFLIDDK